MLRCATDRPGRDALTLAELTANRAAALARRLAAQTAADGAAPDTDSAGNPSSVSDYDGPAERRTDEDVYNGTPPTYANPGTRVGLPGF